MSTPARTATPPLDRALDDANASDTETQAALRRVGSAFDRLVDSSGDLSRRSARASDRVNAALDRLAESERRRRDTR
ncbi:hypothetical protein [Halobaculum limi]|uniref:hypothetical protein n=1 Tax=Halobaculum limi TaxID=3031916 RepID=UPI002406499E|nr:hypothetical protein [Halobaculum sp. YSMS11]